MADTTQWLALLRAEAERTSIAEAARLIGYSRTAVSLVLAGRYERDTAKLQGAVLQALGAIACPYLERSISGAACLQQQAQAEPPAGSDDYWHWRACRACRVGAGKAGGP